MRLKVMVAGRDKTRLASLEATIARADFDVTCRHVSNGHADPLQGVTDTPDILVMQIGAGGEADLAEIAAQPTTGRPPTIVIGPAGSTACMRLAMQSGARDYLEMPVSSADLNASLERVRAEIDEGRAPTEGALVAVVGAKGGAGASFVAVNLARIMASHSGARVALLDLDLQFSSLAQYLDLRPEHGLLQALDMGEHLDGVALDAYMTRHKSGLAMMGVLKDEMVLTRDVPADRFALLLDKVTANYDRVVVDLPRQVDDVAAAVYERATHVLLVMQQEVSHLHDAARLYNILVRQLNVPADKLHVVVNRYDKNLQVELPDIRRSLNMEDRELMLVPNQYRDVAESINVGVPMFDHSRGSAVTKALIQIESRLAGGRDTGARRNVITRAFASLMKG